MSDQRRRQILRKTLILTILMLLASVGYSQPASAEMGSGLYLTMEDFKEDRLAFYHDNDAHNFLRKDLQQNIRLTRNGITTEYRHGNFFGYQDGDRKYIAYGHQGMLRDYGFYEVEDARAIIVYSKRGHTNENSKFYFFSSSLGLHIKRMTYRNVKNAFVEKPSFLAAINEYRLRTRDRLDRNDRPQDQLVVNDLLAGLMP